MASAVVEEQQKIAVESVDQNEIRTNQALTLVMLASAYALDNRHLVTLQCVFFLFTTLSFRIGPYMLFYRVVLKPLAILKPDLRHDNVEPHRFATGIGFAVSALAAWSLANGATAFGWGLVWLILFLGSLALLGWCAGCFTYFMVNRTGVGGFFRYAPTPGTSLPGARPPRTERKQVGDT